MNHVQNSGVVIAWGKLPRPPVWARSGVGRRRSDTVGSTTRWLCQSAGRGANIFAFMPNVAPAGARTVN